MKGTIAVYVDPAGVPHKALIVAENGLNPGFVSLIYVDVKAPESDNVIKKFDIAHISDKSNEDNNPALPNFIVNAWMHEDEDVLGIPKDHPMFDHPFAPKAIDAGGNIVEPDRPITNALAQAHVAAMSKEDSVELAALSGSGGMAGDPNVLQVVPGGISADDLKEPPHPGTIISID